MKLIAWLLIVVAESTWASLSARAQCDAQCQSYTDRRENQACLNECRRCVKCNATPEECAQMCQERIEQVVASCHLHEIADCTNKCSPLDSVECQSKCDPKIKKCIEAGEPASNCAKSVVMNLIKAQVRYFSANGQL